MSFQEHSYQNLGKQGSEITCSFQHFESGGLAFGRSPKNIFQMFHHDFLGIANKIQHVVGNTLVNVDIKYTV